MNKINKYPRTAHIRGSRLQHGDDLEDVPFEDIRGKHLIIEEKLDGANCGISFDENANLLLQSRGHFLRGGHREQEFDWLKQWANTNVDMLFDMLGDRYVMYGENMYAKHTCFYDALPSYFMEFDILDTQTGEFLSTARRREMIGTRPVSQVLVLYEGPVSSLDDLSSMIKESNFITGQRWQNLAEAAVRAGVDPQQAIKESDMSPDMEGLYIKHEGDGKVYSRFKFVRESFTNTILDSETHWHDRTIIPNRLYDNTVCAVV